MKAVLENSLAGVDVVRGLKERTLGCVDVMTTVLERIEKFESVVQAYVTLVPPDELLRAAEQYDSQLDSKMDVPVLCGVPVAVKDNFCTKGIRTTCGSKMLGNFLAPYNATVVQRLEAAGGVICGKTNMDEFAMGSTTENSAWHVTRNPWNIEHVPGGTSGGSAAALSAGESIFAVGSDTGGSVRQPAAYCGLTGFKPTYGRISRFGLVSYASSLDHVGVFGRSVSDAELLYRIVGGPDPLDSTCLHVPLGPGADDCPVDCNRLRIGWAEQMWKGKINVDLERRLEEMKAYLEEEGVQFVPIDLPQAKLAVPCYYIIASAEASSNLARFDGIKYGQRTTRNVKNFEDLISWTRSEFLGQEVQRRIILGTFVLSAGFHDAFYDKARRVRAAIAADFQAAFKQCDAVLHPVTHGGAVKIGETVSDALTMYLLDTFSVLGNLTGMPAISIPTGTDSCGLPISAHLTGPHMQDSKLLAISRIFEKAAKQIQH